MTPDLATDVCAIVPSPAVLGGQSRAPQASAIVAAGRGALAEAMTSAVEQGATWLWLVDRDVTPAPDALEELLRPLAALPLLDDPVLLASHVVLPDGSPDVGAAPWPRLLARELALNGASHHLAALRAVRFGSLLVHRRALERHGVPRADFAAAGDDLEWTGRVLRDDPGFLVPRSIATRATPSLVDPAPYVRSRVRILRGDGWAGQEKAWFAYLLARDLVQRGASDPKAVPGLALAAARGLVGSP